MSVIIVFFRLSFQSYSQIHVFSIYILFIFVYWFLLMNSEEVSTAFSLQDDVKCWSDLTADGCHYNGRNGGFDDIQAH